MTEKEYYLDKRISSSSLKWFESSPLFFRKMLDKEIEQETKRYFEIGKKIHMRILEPIEYEKNYIYLEFDTPKSENQRKFCEDYISLPYKLAKERMVEAYKRNYNVDKLSEDKITDRADELKRDLSKYITYLKRRGEVRDILNYTDHKLIEDLANLSREHIGAKRLLYIDDEIKLTKEIEEHNEIVIFFDFLGVPCKSMLDRVVINHTDKIVQLIDLKTTINLGEFSHSFEEFKYYRQMAFYWLALYNQYPETRDYKKETYIIGFQKGDTPECRVFSIIDSYLNYGLNEIEKLFPKIKWHFDNDKWDHTKEYYDNEGIEIL